MGFSSAARGIAIVGMGCRFPGANSVPEFWDLLCNGMDATSEVPLNHFDVDAVYDPRPSVPGRMSTKRGGFLKDVDQFDPYFFGISPREANVIDPQQRWLLETAWQCVEDAGVTSPQLARSRTGVFVGVCTDDYQCLGLHSGIDLRFAMGIARSNAAGRISYLLGLTGPSLCLDTACSSSLLAIHLAARSIRDGECQMAFAGGVNAILDPTIMIAFSQGGLLAADGRCKAFDQSADGFARSEGAGMILMKPLETALEDGDRIYAVIRGSAANNDGPASLFMAPSRPGQEAVLRDACADAQVSPHEIQYVESHGTGTQVGDPIEIESLASVMGAGRPMDSPLYVGALKTNIGHLEGGAGVAGVIKAALVLKNGIIPANLHLCNPNPAVAWDQLPIVLPTQVTPWPEGKPKLAGVSSFGISGTNVHTIIEAAPFVTDDAVPAEPPAKPRVLLLSARDSQSLTESASRWKNYLGATEEHLSDICHTAAIRRNHFEHRLTIAGTTHLEMEQAISSWMNGEERTGIAVDRVTGAEWRKPVFVFSGVGSQWPRMGLDLRESYPVFRAALDHAEDVIAALAGWSLFEEIQRGEPTTRFGRIDIFQPASVAVQIALADLWKSWGIEPGLVIGHSVGEIPAAYVAGALTFEQALRIAVARSEVMHRAAGAGSMLACELTPQEAELLLEGLEDRVSVGVVNSRTAVVLSGETAVLNGIAQSLERKEVFSRKVRMPVPSHSPLMDPLLDDLRQKVGGIQPAIARIPILSTVDNQIHYGEALTADYWARNLRQTVQFAGAVELALDRGENVFIEVSPHAMLADLVRKAAAARSKPCLSVTSMRRGEDGRFVMLESLGKLHCGGYAVDWRRHESTGCRHVDIPGHPLRPERFWLDVLETPLAVAPRTGSHAMLGKCFQPADKPGTHIWEFALGLHLFPFLAEHSFQTHPVLPATVYCELMLAAATSAYGPGPKIFRNIGLHRSLFFDQGTAVKMQIVMGPNDGGAVPISFYVQSGVEQQPKTWEMYADAMFAIEDQSAPQADEPFDAAAIRDRLNDHFSNDEFYEFAAETGLEYGPSFRSIREIWTDKQIETLGLVQVPEFLSAEVRRYGIHPALCDNLLQLTLAPLAPSTVREPVMPYFIEEVRIAEESTRPEFWVYARHRAAPRGFGNNDLDAIAPDGKVLFSVRGLKSKMIGWTEKSSRRPDWSTWLYDVQWDQVPAAPADLAPGSWLILADADALTCELQDCMERFGQHVVRAPENWKENVAGLLKNCGEASQVRWRGIVYLQGLGADADFCSASQENILGGLLKLVQHAEHIAKPHSPRLFVVTRGAQAVAENAAVHLAQGPLLGFMRSAAIEIPALAGTLIDVDPADRNAAEELAREILSASGEREIALRGRSRLVARLARLDHKELPRRTKAMRLSPSSEESYRVLTSSPGMLDQIGVEHLSRRRPGAREIEIRVAAAGLNFLDVLRGLNMYPGEPSGDIAFGMECAGEVVRVGSDVLAFKPGDRVIALPEPNSGCFQAHLTIAARQAFPLSDALSFEQAATIPVAYQTAWYAIHRLGRLRKGESILIHAGAGGVGLAAIAISKYLGLEIFATAGSDEKREYLRGLGVQHVMDSRTLAFANEVLQITGGRGVDAVLNSIAGEAIAKSLSILATGGRFLEIGKRDIYANTSLGLYPFRKNLSYFAVDMLGLSIENPTLVEDLTREILECVAAGHFAPLPYTAFPAAEARDAFRMMAQAKHIGKVVVTFAENQVDAEIPLNRLIRRDATYLITGGLTGLGLESARWLARQGAGNVVLIGRRGPGEQTREAIAAMEEMGTRVITRAADVSDAQQLKTVLQEIAAQMPPIAGVIHAAGMLRDGIVQNLAWSDFETTLAPKIQGAWNLHEATRGAGLDFFVLFSSIASMLGSPGQVNYSAGNAFLDALAQHRRSLGLPALCLNWGPWAEIGMAAQAADRGDRMAGAGMRGIPPADGIAAMQHLVQKQCTRAAVMNVDWKAWGESYSILSYIPYFSRFQEELKSGSGQAVEASLARQIRGLNRDEALSLIEGGLREDLRRVLRIPEDRLDRHTSLTRLGLDSLMAVELKNRIDSKTGMSVPVMRLLKGPTLAEMTTMLYEILNVGPAGDVDVDALSDAEVDTLLRQLAG